MNSKSIAKSYKKQEASEMLRGAQHQLKTKKNIS